MHHIMEETELLRLYVSVHSEQAFGELVRRKIGLVYSAALRQVGGDPHLAEEVAQVVFTTLAKKAGRVVHHPSLSGWLHTTTHLAAAQIMRKEQRRRRRESEAYLMKETQDSGRLEAAAPWEDISGVLDQALLQLEDHDREALLLRFFDSQTYSAIGRRLGLSEDATRKRIDRALDRLRVFLARRGVVCTAAALSTDLATRAIASVPSSLADRTTATALEGSAAPSNFTMNILKISAATFLALGAALLVRSQGVRSNPNPPFASTTLAEGAAPLVSPSSQPAPGPFAPTTERPTSDPITALAPGGTPATVYSYHIEGISVAEMGTLTAEKILAERTPDWSWQTKLVPGVPVAHESSAPDLKVSLTITLNAGGASGIVEMQEVFPGEINPEGKPGSVASKADFVIRPGKRSLTVGQVLRRRPGTNSASAAPSDGKSAVRIVDPTAVLDGHIYLMTLGDPESP